MIMISGHSDDVVEIFGDWQDEIGCFDQIVTIEFDDGTEIEMEYGDVGTWHVKVLREGSADYRIEKRINNGDYYSDLFAIETDSIVSVKTRNA